MIPTSNHNLSLFVDFLLYVVYLLIPTSNHNTDDIERSLLWVVYLLIPTSNHNIVERWELREVVVYLLIPTSNHNPSNFYLFRYKLYIFWFLHQTTTIRNSNNKLDSCISFDSYIKPQLVSLRQMQVVGCISFDSYIKPQLYPRQCGLIECCISFDSYIKPQLYKGLINLYLVVYLLIPTSNHNQSQKYHDSMMLYIFWFLHQTTTLMLHRIFSTELYIFWFLHQTTTYSLSATEQRRCISFDSYIKPQLNDEQGAEGEVVYLLIPTSNHNSCLQYLTISPLYIFWFLHQTTTPYNASLCNVELYIFWFLHQTTTYTNIC